jgi:putative heme iron utilization protein
MTTTPIQVRLATTIVEAIDQRASAANITRAEALRALVEQALAGPQAPAHDPLLDQIAEAVGTLLARSDTILEVGRSARNNARGAYVAAYRHALTALPAAERTTFAAKVAEKLEKQS